MELTYSKTIDTYRARLHNPKTVLKELLSVLIDFDAGKIKHFDPTVTSLKAEARNLLKEGHCLDFGNVAENHFNAQLGVEKGQKDNHEGFKSLIYTTTLLIETNAEYAEKLLDEIASSIQSCNLEGANLTPNKLAGVNRLVGYFASEMLDIGFSKEYLHRFVQNQFFKQITKPFEERLGAIRELVGRGKECYQVVFRIFGLNPETSAAVPEDLKVGLEDFEDVKAANPDIRRFLEFSGKGSLSLKIKVEARDYLAAIGEAKEVIAELLDALNLSSPFAPATYYSKTFAIGTRNPLRSKILRVDQTIDGSRRANADAGNLVQKLQSIKNDPKIAPESKQKLISGFRYLRLGDTALELEQKFISYWIGLEYLFSDYDASSSTINRMKENFKNIHAVIYFRRNAQNLHDDILRTGQSEQVLSFQSDDLQYLQIPSNLSPLVVHSFQRERSPLLSLRVSDFLEKISNDKKRKDSIDAHQQNVEWNLTRCYRIRNEIVHDAAIKTNITVLAGNIRYYLIFMLNASLDFFANLPTPLAKRGSITIDDFFIVQEVEYQSLKKNDFPIDKLFKVKNPVEIISSY